METRQLICSANQLTGFYVMATLAFNELIFFLHINEAQFNTVFILILVADQSKDDKYH